MLLALSYSATLLVPDEYPTIQSAIDASSDGDSVLVSAGAYVENINFNGKNIALIGEDRETTIIDGNQNGSVVTFESGEIRSFTIQNGNAEIGGGGINNCSAGTVKISNCIIINNSANRGGGIYLSCYYPASYSSIYNCLISHNQAEKGGGIFFADSSGEMYHSLITENEAQLGGGIYVDDGHRQATNITIANNLSQIGGGIYSPQWGNIDLENSIIWENAADSIANIGGNVGISFSDIQGNWDGTGNIDADPLFCDAENGDFTVQSDSPVLGAGQDGADMGAYGVGCEPDDVCSACNIYYTDGYPGFCCDMAWDEGGLTCLYVETEWGLDCGGCNCFGDFAFCEEQGLMMCSDYSCAESLSQCPPECDLGDVNCDGEINVLDIVLAANMVLANEYDEIADMNEDGELNILDLVIMVNLVLYGDDGACTDIDGNIYETVQIGDQLWMAENLKVTHYNNGDEITHITNNEDWVSLSTGAYGDYDNNPTNSETYGRLYNWYTVDDSRGLCMEGWHVPSDEEYTVLKDYLGGTSVAGGKMKEAGLEHWNYYSDEITEEATNESGFTGLPAGYRTSYSGAYYDVGNLGSFWSSSEYNSNYAWYRLLTYSYSNVYRYYYHRLYGFSIRCLGD